MLLVIFVNELFPRKKKKRKLHVTFLLLVFPLFFCQVFPTVIIINETKLQWDPPSLDKVDDEKVDFVFQPFQEELELAIPEMEDCRYVLAFHYFLILILSFSRVMHRIHDNFVNKMEKTDGVGNLRIQHTHVHRMFDKSDHYMGSS